ncbi:hypothetical protein CXG81DRAFT_12563 [Caulochytrium protostelioides]|uniref:Mg2+ transporter protein n=1 Tax=Caulochytrium protostelioides TaxID=1555241 RepID=A0A4P9X6X4_9FUNG|nr:Mg2+ transporter protein [Caulochytrium protostelioides]RKP00966.1 hypothetical protein CXG81DRAFT_12563 [Caulochytrium protostelioides]|eukprot:RKP00966.1 hypothetical protein CXG81DRAFT_12563 [Caulochytrium protostelioides]
MPSPGFPGSSTELAGVGEALGPRFTFYSRATGTLAANTLESLPFAERGDALRSTLRQAPFWLDVTDVTHSEMQFLSRAFAIHPLTMEDIQMEETREKCELFSNYYFITIRAFDQSGRDGAGPAFMTPVNFYLVIGRDCAITFHSRHLPHTANVLQRIQQLQAFGLQMTPDWVNYALIDDITDSFMPSLRFVELEVDAIDDLVLILKENEQADMLRRIGHARKRVMQLLRLLSTKADVLKTVIKRTGERLAPGSETILYLSDIQDHVITMTQNLSHYEKTLARAHANYLAQISIEITVASNRTNDVVMRMTALASVLVPLNVITGMWGMNVHVPGQDADSLGWFFGILAGMFVTAVTTFYLVRKAAQIL